MAREDGATLFRKLNRLFKNSNQLRRKIKSRDTALVVPDKTKSSGVLLFQKSSTPAYATITSNAYNLSERLMRYQDFCFGKNTIVYTLEGAFTIEELTQKYKQGERFFVYSYDYEEKRPVIGTAFSPRIAHNGKVTQKIKITFDDGGFIELTPDHKVILRDGSTLEAKDLKINDSLMPLYVSDINKFGYNWIYMLSKNQTSSGWLGEHRLVAEHFYGKLNENDVVHHKDFNRKNNHPSNLVVMSEEEHNRYHAQLNNCKKYGKPNQKIHDWWKQNSPNKRTEVTFNSIVDACLSLKTQKIKDIQCTFKINRNSILRRLREYGFINWQDFLSRFDEAQQYATHNTIVLESTAPDIDTILQHYNDVKSLDELACKLHCTCGCINKRLQTNGYPGGWTQLKHNKIYSGKKRGPTYTGPSYQTICSIYQTGMTAQELAIACNTSKGKIGTCLKQQGYFSYTKWQEQFRNHKVAQIEYIQDDIVYNITVEKYHNLAVGSLSPKNPEQRAYSLVFCTNCEQEYTPELASALDIYASEVCATDIHGQTVHVYSENEKIKEVLDDLFYNTLNIEYNIHPWVRNLCKYGDCFVYIDVSPEYGVLNCFPIPVNEIEREENYDRNDPFAVRFRWVSLANRVLENWEIAHFRLLSNDAFLPYGSSVLEPARRIWRQLILAEDAMLVYRVVRSPERRVFYIDVGNLPPEEVENYVEQQKRRLLSNEVVDATTGRVDKRYNAISVEDNYWLPVRGSNTATKIDTLPGGQNATAIDDVKYLQQKMFAALKIPAAWLGYTENLASKASLSQLDVRFSRTISTMQKAIVSELNKIAVIHLFSHGFSSDDLINFSIKLTNPSSIAEQQKLQLWRDRFEIMDGAPKDILSQRWLAKNILSLTDYDIRQIAKEKAHEGSSGEEEGSSGGGMFGGGSSSGSTESDLASKIFGGENEEGGEEGETAPEGGEEEITAGNDPLENEEDVDLLLSNNPTSNKTFPLKPVSRANQVSKHRNYVKHKKSGRADIGMSNNDEIIKAVDARDVFDVDFFRDTAKNNLNLSYESVNYDQEMSKPHHTTSLAKSVDMVHLLEKMKTRGFGKGKKNSLLSEEIEVEIDVQDEINNTSTDMIFENLTLVNDESDDK